MNTDLLAAPGESVSADQLRTRKGIALVSLLESKAVPFVALVDTRRIEGADILVLEVEPEVPQHPRITISHNERIATVLFDDDRLAPMTLALRAAFPVAPHMNVVDALAFPSLCLFEEPYEELRTRWTAAMYLRRLHEWLSLTAQGRLHQNDQPLEPFIASSAVQVVLPSELFDDTGELKTLAGYSIDSGGKIVYVTQEVREDMLGSEPAVRVIGLLCEPQVHGIIRRRPHTFAELHELLNPTGCDLRTLVREQLKEWKDRERFNPEAGLLMLIYIPLQRTERDEPERIHHSAFAVGTSIKEVGDKLGLWYADERHLPLRIPAQDLTGDGLGVELLRPVQGLSPACAAAFNGIHHDARHILAVGIGAIGSQLTLNLARSGFGTWVLIDHDTLLPHNVARHALQHSAVGFNKAEAMAAMVNGLFDGTEIARAIPTNVLTDLTRVDPEVREADVILDMSASVPVARALAVDSPALARRMSVFLNPSGDAAVLLAEGQDRVPRLDDLEMQYYRAVLTENAFHDHVRPRGARIRYGQSCRDVTVTMSQESVALFAAMGARGVREALAHEAATILVWRSNAGEIATHDATVRATQALHAVGWELRTDTEVIERMLQLRDLKLPNETGGVLLGHHDLDRRIIYVIDVLPASADSEEWPAAYIRGSRGLSQQIDEIQARSGNVITYVGEWHSHPRGCAAMPSPDDAMVALWIAEHMDLDERPALMAIAGDEGVRWYLGEVLDRTPALAIRLVEAA